MPEKCVNGRCTKEGGACPVCGGAVPPSLGCKPRIYCSPNCCLRAARGTHERDNAVVNCGMCGVAIQYAGRGPRPKVGDSCRDCKKAAKKCRPTKTREYVCERCSTGFKSKWKKRFCSPACQYDGRGDVHGLTKPCQRCQKQFKVRRKGHSFCSRACAKEQQVYKCLNCLREFKRRRFKSGSYSFAKKYCSRECAFEARRRKLPCTLDNNRKGARVSDKLASWFLAWGDDYFPHVYKCCDCGASMQHKKNAQKHEKCRACMAHKIRLCVDCGSPELAPTSAKRCEPCRIAARAAAKKRTRRLRKRKHGNAHTIRKRCRWHNAPYTPVSRQKILDRDGWRCQLCGMQLLPRYTRLAGGGVHSLSPTIDHIIPLARGPDGPGHVESNCQAACWGCNTEKSDIDPDSFAALKATDLDSKAWQKAQHQRRSTSSRCEGRRKPTTERNLELL